MRLDPLLDRWPDDPAFAELLDAVADQATGVDVVVPDVARAFLLAGVARAGGRLVVVTTATTDDAETLAEDVAAFLGSDRVATFPAWETLPHERLSPRAETVARRLALLHRLSEPEGSGEPQGPGGSGGPQGGPPVGRVPEGRAGGGLALLTVPARAMMQPLAPGLDRVTPVRVARGDRIELEDLLERLVAAGYQRTDMVERRGEVAVRGGLVDFFPPGEDHPVRVELWGDEVDSIRAFAVASQRSLTELPEVTAWPCREVLLTDTERDRARQLAGEFPTADDLLARVAEGLDVEGVEALLPLLFDDLRLLPDYLPGDAVLVLLDPKRTLDRAEEVRIQADEAMQASWATAAEGATAPVEGVAYRPLPRVLEGAGTALLRLGAFDSGAPTVLRVDAHPVEPYRANVTRIAADARELAAAGSTVLLCTEGPGPAHRLVEALRDEGLTVPSLAAELPADLGPGVLVGTAPLLTGFRLPGLKLALLAEGDLYGTRRQTREQARMPSSRRRAGQAALPVAVEELQPGDIVVHAVHGIGRYIGMEQRSVGGAERDYLVLAYDQGDRLYLPSEQVELISRYVGGEAPKLSRLGSRDWDRQKARVRRKVREMAAELVRLYSARMASPGHAFAPD
ncbi:MAG TPA: CarD family transcriptional regulator, partial [Actinomycetes bacterium]